MNKDIRKVVEKAPGRDGFLPWAASGSGPEFSGQSGSGGETELLAAGQEWEAASR